MAHVDLDHLPPLPADRSVGIGCIGAGFIMADCDLVAYRAAGLNPIAIAARRPDAAAEVAARRDRIRGILAQKPLATNYAEASRIVERWRRCGRTCHISSTRSRQAAA